MLNTRAKKRTIDSTRWLACSTINEQIHYCKLIGILTRLRMEFLHEFEIFYKYFVIQNTKILEIKPKL